MFEKKEQISVSVVSANYNNGPFLHEFIQSIINSDKHPLELIIIDDGSTDNSREILNTYTHLPFAKFIFFPANKGFAHALNEGLRQANGEFILRADPDDILHHQRISRQYEYILNKKHLAGLGCNVRYFKSYPQKMLSKSNFPIKEEEIRKSYYKGEHGMQHPTVMLRAEVYKKYSYRQEWVPAEDYDIFAQMSNDGYCFENISDALYFMRIHPASASSRLKFDTIEKTFALRKAIFGETTSARAVKLYFLHMKYYRSYLLSENKVLRNVFLIISALFRPSKVLKRTKML